jgi:hypothetical protein
MEDMQYAHHIQANNKLTHNSTSGEYTRNIDHFGARKTIIPQLTWLTSQQMDEIREKGLCFNCDNKYINGHKCNDKKLFYIENK